MSGPRPRAASSRCKPHDVTVITPKVPEQDGEPSDSQCPRGCAFDDGPEKCATVSSSRRIRTRENLGFSPQVSEAAFHSIPPTDFPTCFQAAHTPFWGVKLLLETLPKSMLRSRDTGPLQASRFTLCWALGMHRGRKVGT